MTAGDSDRWSLIMPVLGSFFFFFFGWWWWWRDLIFIFLFFCFIFYWTSVACRPMISPFFFFFLPFLNISPVLSFSLFSLSLWFIGLLHWFICVYVCVCVWRGGCIFFFTRLTPHTYNYIHEMRHGVESIHYHTQLQSFYNNQHGKTYRWRQGQPHTVHLPATTLFLCRGDGGGLVVRFVFFNLGLLFCFFQPRSFVLFFSTSVVCFVFFNLSRMQTYDCTLISPLFLLFLVYCLVYLLLLLFVLSFFLCFFICLLLFLSWFCFVFVSDLLGSFLFAYFCLILFVCFFVCFFFQGVFLCACILWGVSCLFFI